MPDRADGPVLPAPAPPGVDVSDGLSELRALLVGPEREHLSAIQGRLDNPDLRRREIGEVLPEVLLQHALDPELARALAPGVERAITASVRQNPAPLADALFPVMGPAIRKAVSSGLAAMVESISRTLEQSVSWRSVLWRLEALRTGKSFAEVVLVHTLLYRVEQVFLIERASGLLLCHVHDGDGEVRDADMVSGMLTAIRDFVQDSFNQASAEGGLEALKVGDLSVWIEQGPRAVIAAVLRGVAPREYRTRLQSANETIHLEFSEAFERFTGDTDLFTEARPALEACLHTEYRSSGGQPRRRVWALAAIALVGLSVWGGFALRDRLRWGRYLEALSREPGIVVVSSGRSRGRFTVTGLRDPLARDPQSLLAASSLAPTDIDAQWQLFHASDQTLALARARDVLLPPAGTSLALENGVLTVSGTVGPRWLTESARLAALIPGVVRLDAAPAIEAAVSAIVNRMQAATPLFAKGLPQLAPGQDMALRQLTGAAVELQELAAATGRRYRVEVVGHADTDGAPEANLPLSRARAEVVRSALAGLAAERLDVAATGVGSGDPVVSSDREADKQRNRRVTVRVTPLDSPR